MATLKQVPAGLEYAYKEPSTNSNGSPLVDLDHTSIFVDVGAGPVKIMDVPATAAAGGGDIVQILQNPFAEGQEGTVTAFSIAVDDNGNEGLKGGEATADVDFLAPGPTQ